MKIKLKQNAVYWAPGVSDGEGGTAFTQGVEIKCRWEDKQVNYVSDKGETEVSRSIVFTDRDVFLKGYLFLGLLQDLTSSAGEDPTEEHDAYEIKSFNKIPSVKGNKFERTAVL